MKISDTAIEIMQLNFRTKLKTLSAIMIDHLKHVSRNVSKNYIEVNFLTKMLEIDVISDDGEEEIF